MADNDSNLEGDIEGRVQLQLCRHVRLGRPERHRLVDDVTDER